MATADLSLPSLITSTTINQRRIRFLPAQKSDFLSASVTNLTPLNSAVKAGAQTGGEFEKFVSAIPMPITLKSGKSTLELTWNQVRGVGAGLSNLGNTCFMNATLQCLTYTAPLALFFEASEKHIKECRSSFCAYCELRLHILKALGSPHRVVVPTALARGLRQICRRFRPGRQEDAHEYLIYLLEALHNASLPPEIAKVPSAAVKANSFVNDCFGGTLKREVVCSSCSHSSQVLDPFLDLSLEISRADSLQKALERFSAPSVLDGDNKYSCSGCKSRVRAVTRMSIQSAPPVLCVQLKRFGVLSGMKINKMVDFPMRLNLQPFMAATVTPAATGESAQDSLHYLLYAVLVHSGGSTHSGHYYSYVKSAAGTWHLMDDSRVTQVSEATVLKQRAYLLFYQRQPPQPSTSQQPAATTSHSSGSKAPPALAAGVPSVPAPAPVVVTAVAAEASKPVQAAGRSKGRPALSAQSTFLNHVHRCLLGQPVMAAKLSLRLRVNLAIRSHGRKRRVDLRQAVTVEVKRRRTAQEQVLDLVADAGGSEEQEEGHKGGKQKAELLQGGKGDDSSTGRETQAAQALVKGASAVRGRDAVVALQAKAAAAAAAAKVVSAGLFNAPVSVWEDGVADAATRSIREAPAKAERAPKRRYDDWDAALDTGRVKKVRAKVPVPVPAQNPFQAELAVKPADAAGLKKVAPRKASKLKRLEERRASSG